MPLLFKKVKGTFNVKNMIFSLITFSIVMIMTFMSAGDKTISLNNLTFVRLVSLFFSGMIASASMLLPGISGSFVLMLIGYYYPIINAIREFTKLQNSLHNVILLSTAGIGIILGIIIAAKLIEYLLKKYEIPTYYGIIGFVISSIISIFITAVSSYVGTVEIIVGILLMILGIFLAGIIGDK